MQVKRDVSFDILRAIGLLLIILAHVLPPAPIFQLRNFDVPLMMFVSGAVFGISSGASKGYLSYLISRVRRLVLPTWIFLTIFFGLYFLASLIKGFPFPFHSATIINSYNLVSGIGYVWIIRVFLFVAITLPLYVKLAGIVKNIKIYLVLLALIYGIYELLYFLYPGAIITRQFSSVDWIFQNVIFYILPYSVVAGLGLVISKINKQVIIYLTLVSFVILAALAFANNFVATQNFKYPPRIYYLSYALSVSLLLYLLSKTKIFTQLLNNKIVLFIGSYSLWIYLWQILFLYIWRLVPKISILNNFIIEYCFVLFFAVLITYLQRIIVKSLLNKLTFSAFTKSLLVDGFLK
jgi:fucose 4-O-acetylase-like acetyltransferase